MYWSQWNHTELMSMQGIELDKKEVDVDLEQEEDNLKEISCCTNGCLKCLDLSWRDFM